MKVTFNINFHTVWGQKLCVVGSIPELGSWEPALAKEMSYKGDGNWQLELEVTSPVKDIEYRYFLSVNDKQIFEEWEKNHQVFFKMLDQPFDDFQFQTLLTIDLCLYKTLARRGVPRGAQPPRFRCIAKQKGHLFSTV